MSGFGILVWMSSKKIRWSCQVHKLNSTTEEWIFPLLLIIRITPSPEPLVSAQFSWFTTPPVSSSSSSFHTRIPPLFCGLGVRGRVKTVLSKISLISLGTETGTPHATEGSKDIRSLRRDTLEKQLTSLKAKSSLPFSTDFANEDKAIEIQELIYNVICQVSLRRTVRSKSTFLFNESRCGFWIWNANELVAEGEQRAGAWSVNKWKNRYEKWGCLWAQWMEDGWSAA